MERCYNHAAYVFNRSKSKTQPRVVADLWEKTACEEPVMLRLIRPAAIILLVVAISLSAAASANSLFKKGKDAEARQNYEQAYEYYKQAYDLKPKDLAYRAAYERLRFYAGASHVKRGQLLRDSGKLDEALAEFQKRLRSIQIGRESGRERMERWAGSG